LARPQSIYEMQKLLREPVPAPVEEPKKPDGRLKNTAGRLRALLKGSSEAA